MGSIKLVGASVSSLGEALKAEKEGASYLGLGPVYDTPIKAGKNFLRDRVIGLIKKRVKIPVIAIGGIDLDNVNEVIRSGADGVSVIRAVCGAKDICEAAKELKEKIVEAEEER